MPEKYVSIALSVALLVADFAAIWGLYKYSKRPIDPLRPRLIPNSVNTFLFLVLVIVSFAIMAHIVSLVTGVQLQPKRKRGL
ncbi:MAG: hypothetical protein FJX59_05225 [Alphaproteobacteria bacterium]|nr:hypothetical protein [Alphaproteobacteria bacterium]